MSAIVPAPVVSYLGKRAIQTLAAYSSNKRLRTATASFAGGMARRAANYAARRIQRSWRARSRAKAIRSNRRKASRGYVKKALHKATGEHRMRNDEFNLTPGVTNTLYNLNGPNEHVIGDIGRGTKNDNRDKNAICLKGIHLRAEILNSATGYDLINCCPLYVRFMLVGKKYTGTADDGTRLYSGAIRLGDRDPVNYSDVLAKDGYLKHCQPLEKKLYKIYWQKRLRVGAGSEVGRYPVQRYVNKLIKFRSKKFTWVTSLSDPSVAGEIFPDMRLLMEVQKDSSQAAEMNFTFRAQYTTYFTS